MAKGLAYLEGVVAKGGVLNEAVTGKLDKSVQHYWNKPEAARRKAADRERRVRALKAASKGNE